MRGKRDSVNTEAVAFACRNSCERSQASSRFSTHANLSKRSVQRVVGLPKSVFVFFSADTYAYQPNVSNFARRIPPFMAWSFNTHSSSCSDIAHTKKSGGTSRGGDSARLRSGLSFLARRFCGARLHKWSDRSGKLNRTTCKLTCLVHVVSGVCKCPSHMFPLTPNMLPKKITFGAPQDGHGPDATVPLS